MLSEFNEPSDPIQFGKHRNCYASYTNLRDFKSDCTTTTENGKALDVPILVTNTAQ